jgi:methylated-DNA-[protein]-cysteine S-methyltransferase
MKATSFARFDTAIGPCGIAWNEHEAVVGVRLPAVEGAPASRWFAQAREATPPPAVAAAIGGIVALLQGEPRDLAEVPLDMQALPAFDRRVYELARLIAPGHTLTYGELARRLGEPGAARRVGQALGRNPFPLVVPCHRVLAAGGHTGGFSAPGGVETKLRLLAIEGATPSGTLPLF